MKFKDTGKHINTACDDKETIQNMLDVAESKGWDSIKISGTPEFQRQMWLEAQLRGIRTSGYNPCPEDFAQLEHHRNLALSQVDDVVLEQPTRLPQKQRDNIKTILKNVFLHYWESIVWKWEDFTLFGKFLFLLFVVFPTTFITLAIIFDEQTNQVTEFIHAGARLSVLVFVIAAFFWIAYMFETPQRRRKFYLILMTGLWLAFGYSHFFGEDPDIKYRLMVMAVVGSVWLIIPLFLSMFRPIFYYHDD